MAWKPIRDRSWSRRAHEAISSIAESLLDETERLEDPSLSTGLAGPALFFSYLDKARPSESFSDASVVCLERAMDRVAAGRCTPSLVDGFCGIGWAIEHVQPCPVESEEDPLSELDDPLVDYIGSLDERPPVELMYGLAGMGLYLLERLPRPSALKGLRRLLTRLEETAERLGRTCTWPRLDPVRLEVPPPGDDSRSYALGVAHGVPGVIGFLARLYRAGVEPDRARQLAEGAVGWLLEQECPALGDSRFPSAVGPGVEPEPARTAWCSGDLGIASVLLQAARVFGRRDWEQRALEWARLAARRAPEKTRATDPSLCHGTAGLGHLFLRLHGATGDAALGEAARFWFERTLATRRPGEGLAGFLSWSTDAQGRDVWRGEPGLLTGVCGIGLALLAASSDVEPRWDRILLVS